MVYKGPKFYVKADEQEDYDGEIESDFSPREYDSWSQKADVPSSQYQSSTSVKKPIIPPRPSYGYPAYDVEVSTLPSFKDKLDQTKMKFEKNLKNKVDKAKKTVDQARRKADQAMKKLEKELKDKMGALKQKKLKKVVESKIPITTTLAPVYVYERIVTKAVKVKKVKKPKKPLKCRKLAKALFG
uniref:Uncharacterized protein n=1 Tax=Tetranychus urticae TaxID=32264 RepID=T1JYJ3_TETUR